MPMQIAYASGDAYATPIATATTTATLMMRLRAINVLIYQQ